MACTHDNIEIISKKIAYRKHIRDLEFETREVLERGTSNQNIENIWTRLHKTRLEKNQMTTVQGLGSILVRDFCYVLNYPLIESFDSLESSYPCVVYVYNDCHQTNHNQST